MMKPNKKTSYYANGNIHGEDYFLNGERHCETGPAYIRYHELGGLKSEEWYLEGERHRKDNPALIAYGKSGNVWYKSWWLKGKEISMEAAGEINITTK